MAEGQEIFDTRQHELLQEFDEIVEELYFLSVGRKELVQRIDMLAEGGE